jgi:hypothetical protein
LSIFNISSEPNSGLTARDFDLLNEIQTQEEIYVQTLAGIVTSLGGTPVQSCTYDFRFGNNLTEFLMVVFNTLYNCVENKLEYIGHQQ